MQTDEPARERARDRAAASAGVDPLVVRARVRAAASKAVDPRVPVVGGARVCAAASEVVALSEARERPDDLLVIADDAESPQSRDDRG